MKKLTKISIACALLLSTSVQFSCLTARGGDAAVGLVGGLAVGTMLGSAAASSGNRSSRAEQEAIRAQDKTERLEREMDRRDLEQRLGGHNTMVTVLVVVVGLLLLVVIALGVVVLRRKF